MNTLKPMLIFAVLIGVCYGVYTRHQPQTDRLLRRRPWSIGKQPNRISKCPRALAARVITKHRSAGQQFRAGSDPRRQRPLPELRGGNFPPTATFTLGPGARRLTPMAARWPAIPGWRLDASGRRRRRRRAIRCTARRRITVSGNLRRRSTPRADTGYGQPPAYGQDAGNAGGLAGQDLALTVKCRPAATRAASIRPGDRRPTRSTPGSGGAPMTPFAAALEQARHELDAGRLSEAHYRLSRWYDDPNLTPQEQQQLNELARPTGRHGHLFDAKSDGARLRSATGRDAGANRPALQRSLAIAGQDQRHRRSAFARPGERLKVVRGPFSAVISLEKRTLTLMLNNAYAGRFPIGIGQRLSAAPKANTS